MARKHEVIGDAVAAIWAAGLPVYQAATQRRSMVPGVAVRLGWRPGTLDVSVQASGASLADVRAALAAAGFVEVYVNEPGEAVSVRPPRRVNPSPSPGRLFDAVLETLRSSAPDTAAWMAAHRNQVLPLFRALAVRIAERRPVTPATSPDRPLTLDDVYDPEDEDPFRGIRDGALDVIYERAARLVKERHFRGLPPDLTRMALGIYGPAVLHITLIGEGLDSGYGGDRWGRRGLIAAWGPERTPKDVLLGGEPPTVRDEHQAREWLRHTLDAIGLDYLTPHIEVQKPRWARGEWNIRLLLDGRRVQDDRYDRPLTAYATTRTEALSKLLADSALWHALGKEVLHARGWRPPTSEQIPRSAAGVAAVEERERAKQAAAEASSQEHARLQAALDRLKARFVQRSREVSEAMRAYPNEFRTLRDLKAAIAHLPGWRVTSYTSGTSTHPHMAYIIYTPEPEGFRFPIGHIKHARTPGVDPARVEELFTRDRDDGNAHYFGLPGARNQAYLSVEAIERRLGPPSGALA